MLQRNMLLDRHGQPLRDRLDGYEPSRPENPEFREALARDVAAVQQASGYDLSGVRLDAFVNELTALGTTWGDKTRGGLPGGPDFSLYRMSYPEAEARYRGSDLGRNIVDKPIDEMLRRGWDVEVQPTDDEQAIAADAPAKMDAARREPRRAAAGWRRLARGGRLDGAQRNLCRERARRWDAVAMGTVPPEAAPPPPPGPLPQVNNEAVELGEAIETWAEKLRAPREIAQALRYERAFGGGCVFIGVDDGGRPLTEPLDPARVKRVTHLQALRGGWDGEVIMWRPYRFAICEKYGQPEIFQVRNTTVPIAAIPVPGEKLSASAYEYPPSPSGPTLFYVHESRFLIFDGEPTSIEAQQEMRGWGDSVFTRVGDPLAQFEQGWNAVAVLMQEASIGVLAIDGFARAMAEKGAAARDQFIQVARLQAITQSVARMRYIDKTETFTRTNTTFAGIAELLDRGIERIAAAAGIPVSVLFGNLQGGLGAKEDPSARGWYATVESRQQSRLLPALDKLYRLGWRCKEGPTHGREPEKWTILFRPLWQLTELEQADLRLKTSQADQIDITQQIVTPEEVAATRYGSPEYNPGPIVLDMDARSHSAAPSRSLAGSPAVEDEPVPVPAPEGAPIAATSIQAEIPPIRVMPTDPITGTPTSTPTVQGETAERGDDFQPEHAPPGSPEGGAALISPSLP